MLPSPRPVRSADASIVLKRKGRQRRPFQLSPIPLLLHSDRNDLIIDELGPDVVVLVDRVVHLAREGLVVGLDQPLVLADLVVPIADRRAVELAGGLDG